VNGEAPVARGGSRGIPPLPRSAATEASATIARMIGGPWSQNFGPLGKARFAPVCYQSGMNHLIPMLAVVATTSFAFAGHADRAAANDVVLDWNAILEATILPTDPFLQTRTAAITQLAVFDAVNSILGEYAPYGEKIDAPVGASPEAAVIAAAHRVLATLVPEQAATLDALRAQSLATVPDGPGKLDGIAVGVTAADLMLALRVGDGSDANAPYTPGTQPGQWQPTPPAFAPALRPGWGRVLPFAVASSAQFRPKPPPSIHSGVYARAYNEIQEIGGATSGERPEDRTNVARFYAVVLGIDCWNPAARQASVAQRRTLSENARAFALLAMAIHDALISSTEAKFHYQFWRPVTAIRAGATDDNHRTEPDPNFLPLINTPPFPGYPSNHGCIAGAARAVLSHVFGEDGHTITLSSDKIPEVVLNYTAWEQICDDIDDARMFGGIHFRFDQEAGQRQGRRVGEYILRHELRPVRAHDCPPRRDR
jgi:hypothetical protein